MKEPELEVTKYMQNRDYYFRVKAANEYGVAEPSMPAMLRKKEGLPPKSDEHYYLCLATGKLADERIKIRRKK